MLRLARFVQDPAAACHDLLHVGNGLFEQRGARRHNDGGDMFVDQRDWSTLKFQ